MTLMLPDPVVFTGLPLWVLCVVLGVTTFFVTLWWPEAESPIVILMETTSDEL